MNRRLRNSALVHKVRSTIKREKLLKDDFSPVIVGVSGGADSCALLLVLKLLNYHVIAAHCNFSLRGQESLGDESFVEELCRSWQIPLEKRTWDTREYAQSNKKTIEVSAREIRYSFFQELLQLHDAQAIAVAHHAEDNIETQLQHLAKGCGIKGLRGMLYKRDSIVRPFLDISPKDLYQFLSLAKISYRTDTTNEDITIERNFVRHRLRPLFNHLNPSFGKTSTRTFAHLRELEAVYEEYISSQVNDLYSEEEGINMEALLATRAPFSLLYEILSPMGFNHTQQEGILTLFSTPYSKNISSFYSQKFKAYRDGKILRIERLSERGDVHSLRKVCQIGLKWVHDNASNFPLIFPPFSFLIADKTAISFEGAGKKNLLLDWDEMRLKGVELFDWRPLELGESFAPFGMKGRRKTIKKFLHDAKIPQTERQGLWGLVSDLGEVLWIPGIASSHHYHITHKTSQVLLICLTEDYVL